MEKILQANKPTQTNLKKWVVPLLAIIAAAALPLFVNSYMTSVLVIIGIYCITTVGVSLLMGFAGLVSLAQAAFWGVGAYVTGVMAVSFGITPWLGLLLSIIISGALAYGLGWITRNLNGHYFSLATLGFGIVLNIILIEESDWTGGSSGLSGIPGLAIGDFAITGDTIWFYFVWVIALVCLYVSKNLVQSGWGRNLRSMHASHSAAEAMGINTGSYRLTAFVISALFAGLSGGLYACYMSFVSPAVFTFDMSIKFVVMAVLGGLVSIWGSLVGVVVVTLLVELLREYVPLLLHDSSSGGAIEVVFFGVLLVTIMIYLPDGIMGIFQRKKSKIRVDAHE